MRSHLEENLRGDVVGEIADNGKLVREQLFQLQLQEVPFHQPALHALEVREKVFHALRVNLDEPKVNVFPLQQVLGKDAHPGAYFQNGGIGFPRPPFDLKPLSVFLRKTRGRSGV